MYEIWIRKWLGNGDLVIVSVLDLDRRAALLNDGWERWPSDRQFESTQEAVKKLLLHLVNCISGHRSSLERYERALAKVVDQARTEAWADELYLTFFSGA